MPELNYREQIHFHLNGFVKQCKKNCPKESCGFIFANHPFKGDDEWYIFPVSNVADDPENEWHPDASELRKVKKKAREMELVRLGSVRSHPIPSDMTEMYLHPEDVIERYSEPSESDLEYARRYNDIVRGIVVCSNEDFYAFVFHDQYGRRIDLKLTTVTTDYAIGFIELKSDNND